MDFTLTEEQKMLRAMVRGFAEKELELRLRWFLLGTSISWVSAPHQPQN